VSEPIFFGSAGEWRAWLEKSHAKAKEVVFGFHKVGTGRAGVTYQEALDEALAYGWIDGVRRGGAEHWTIRFSPRQPKSIWSAVNIRRVGELTALGRMHPAGRAAFEARDPARQNRYSGENRNVTLVLEYERQFRADRRAWAWFEAMPPSYRRPATWWVMSAQKEETRQRRLATLIADSAAARKIKPLTPPGKPRREPN
jgi:uncharacterized protein YdeI (YjbR/CyaY-like superfamily)